MDQSEEHYDSLLDLGGKSQYTTQTITTHLSSVRGILCNFRNVPFLSHLIPRQDPFTTGTRSASGFLFLLWVDKLSGDLLTSGIVSPLSCRRVNSVPTVVLPVAISVAKKQRDAAAVSETWGNESLSLTSCQESGCHSTAV